MKSQTSSSRSVLIVDDEEDLHLVLQVMLENRGFDVVGGATNGVRAISMAMRHQPAIVVLDQAMPGVTGEQAAPLLRRVAPDAKIVAFSAQLEEKPVWADAFLPKTQVVELGDVLEAFV